MTVTTAQLAAALNRLAVARDDQEAWQVLFLGSWGAGLTASSRTLKGQLDLAQDATQEAFHRMIKYADFTRLRDPDAFLSYFRAVCRNVARDALAHFAPELAHNIPLEEFEVPSPRVQLPDTPEEILRAHQLKDAIFSQLDPLDRKLMNLLLEGYSLQEIATLMGLGYGNTAVRLHRLRLVLRNFIK
jgi:RNA polymerase sigma factor (sigma-70 family)